MLIDALVLSCARVYEMLIVVYALTTWFPITNEYFVQARDFLARICEPFFALFRAIIPPMGGMLDFSPIFALLVLEYGVPFLLNLLHLVI